MINADEMAHAHAMTHPHEQAPNHVDLQVMAEVERLLTTTSFATIDDLASRLEVTDPTTAPAPTPIAARAMARYDQPVLFSPERATPLPRRR